MKSKYKKILVFCLLLFMHSVCFSKASDRIIDSLEQLVHNAKNDTLKIHALLQVGEAMYETSHQQAIAYWEEAVKLASKKNSNPKIQRTLDILKGDALNDIAIIYFFDGKVNEALEKNFESMRMRKKTGDIHGMAESMNNLANVYLDQGDTASGLDFFKKSQVYYAQINDMGGVAYVYSNIAKIYIDRNNDAVAMDYLLKSVAILEKMPHLKQGLAAALSRLGSLYQRQHKMAEAKTCLQQSMRLREQANDIINMASSYTGLAAFYHVQNQNDSALYFALKALQEKQSRIDVKADAALVASKIYQKAKQYEKAFDHYQRYISYRDSISNEKTQKIMLRNQYKYAYDNKVVTDSLQHAEETRINIERLDKEKTKQYALFAVVGIILVFSIFLYSRFRIIQKQKNIIQQQKAEVEQQRDIVEEKQKEIIDSINYAQRIQHAILAREEDIKQYFPESFLLYKPKDIVAGDFYFFETTDTHVFYAAADCTGHGVPGALVSVVCSNALTRCIKEFGLTEPGKILDKTRELVLETFSKSGSDVKDGMDISLIGLKFDHLKNLNHPSNDQIFKSSNNRVQDTGYCELMWAGANNPLWIIEPGATSLTEIKGDKQPIGLSANPKPFTTHQVSVPTNSSVFLCTDGFADQFGGEKGKKFKTSNFEKLLVQISTFDMMHQLNEIDAAFNTWKGDYEQLDDICVVGIKV